MISHSHQIPNWITRHTRVLDLGCGNGELLAQLVNSHQIDALGLELDPKIATCLDRGLSVIQQDLNSGLSNFNDQQFDTVIMTQTLQAIRRPDLALSEMLRVDERRSSPSRTLLTLEIGCNSGSRVICQ